MTPAGMRLRSLAGGDSSFLVAGDAVPCSFSPDGNWIVYRIRGTPDHIRIVPSIGGESFEVVLPSVVRAPYTVSWSPDGARLMLTNTWGEIWLKALDPIPNLERQVGSGVNGS